MRRVLFPALTMAALTAAYCWLAWLGAGAYLAWALAQPGFAPTWTTQLAVQSALPFPFHAAALQALAVASLAGNTTWAIARADRAGCSEPALLPLACHVAAVVAALCLGGAGMLSGLVGTAAVLR